MPRGVPKNGFRKTKKKMAALAAANFSKPSQTVSNVFETDAQINERIRSRFEILEQLSKAATAGEVRALIVSGPAGLGKSFTVEKAISDYDPNSVNSTIIKGYVKATGLYKLLYQYREPGKVIIFDDADTIFFDETSLNLLKAVCDSTEKRIVSYLSEGTLIDEDSAVRIPKQFEFNGTIVFITNYDFDAMIDRNHKLTPHLQAMISRAHYIDLSMKSERDYLIRIKQVVAEGLLDNIGLDKSAQNDVMHFIGKNSERLRELSLRIALKVGSIRKTSKNWEKIATVTCCRNI